MLGICYGICHKAEFVYVEIKIPYGIEHRLRPPHFRVRIHRFDLFPDPVSQRLFSRFFNSLSPMRRKSLIFPANSDLLLGILSLLHRRAVKMSAEQKNAKAKDRRNRHDHVSRFCNNAFFGPQIVVFPEQFYHSVLLRYFILCRQTGFYCLFVRFFFAMALNFARFDSRYWLPFAAISFSIFSLRYDSQRVLSRTPSARALCIAHPGSVL